MNSFILLIFEGEKAEKMIYENIKNSFFKNNTILFATYKAEIFQLWNLIEKKYNGDDDIDIIEVLKERGNDDLTNVSREQVTEIHLFFDHDAHSHLSTMEIDKYNNIIENMLNYFSNEYNQGKLWISYPMLEAVKHCKKDPGICFENCIVDINNNHVYKEMVGKLSDYQDIRKFSISEWHYFTAIAVQKTNRLLFNTCIIPPYQKIRDLEQTIIHKKQVDLYISPKLKVAVLSCIPFFLLYYFGESLYNDMQRLKIQKNCQFRCLCSSL